MKYLSAAASKTHPPHGRPRPGAPYISEMRESCGATGMALSRCASILRHKLTGQVNGISPDEFMASVDAGAEFFILDVRPQSAWQQAHIEGAHNIPLVQLKKRLQQEVPRHTPLVLVCADGCDSFAAARTLSGLGATDLYVLDGGMNLWPYATEQA